MSGFALEGVGLTRRYGGFTALDDVTIALTSGEIRGLIGPNGAGKSTLMDALCGRGGGTTHGTVRFQGRDISSLSARARRRAGLARSFQKTNIFPGFTAFENCRLAAQSRTPRVWHVFADAAAYAPVCQAAERALEAAGLAARGDRVASTLSHGEQRQLEIAIVLTIALAGIVGLYLVWVGGAALLAMGVLAVVAALAYTGGPFPYGYRALGEVFVFLFFGLVAVAGTAYLQALRLDGLFLVAAIPPGALITAILVVNNLRDIPTDTAAGKRTLAVVLGRRRTQAEYGALLGVAHFVPALLFLAFLGGWTPSGRAAPLTPLVLLPLLTLPITSGLLARVRGFEEPRELNQVLAGTARLSLAFGLLFGLGLALSGFVPAGSGS